VRELARVLRAGGRLVLSWHGGTDPGRFTRKLTLPEPLLDRIDAALRAELGAVERVRTRRCEVFRAVRGPGTSS
jgi:SAM-dependent methyltransferase